MSRNRKVTKAVYIPNQHCNNGSYFSELSLFADKGKFEKQQEKLKRKLQNK